MKFKNSIIYPIMGVLTLLISIAAIFHYFAQLNLLDETVTIKEELRSKDIRFAIQTIIEKETDKLSALAKALKEQDELVWEIAYYPNSEDDVSYIKEVMDRIYQGLNVDIFLALDKEGKVIYRAHQPDERKDFANYWGIPEVLDGQDIVVVEGSPTWAILSMVPARREDNLYGAIIIGTRIDNEFASEIAMATDVEVSFGSSDGIFASSVSAELREKYFQTDAYIKSLSEEKKVLQELPDGSKAIFYAPVHIVDGMFSLIVEMDLSESQILLAKY